MQTLKGALRQYPYVPGQWYARVECELADRTAILSGLLAQGATSVDSWSEYVEADEYRSRPGYITVIEYRPA